MTDIVFATNAYYYFVWCWRCEKAVGVDKDDGIEIHLLWHHLKEAPLKCVNWNGYLLEYERGGVPEWGICLRCRLKIQPDDYDSHRMLHLLREAP